MFIPKRLIIKPNSRTAQRTQEIIARTRKYNPDVEIQEMNEQKFTYPVSSPYEKFRYMKDSAIISNRSESFIRTFDSPGNIVEHLVTILNLSWMCAFNCQYCYLQTNQTPEHYFYTNFDDAEREIAVASVAHTIILTLWTHLSTYFKKPLLKLPDRFKEVSDWLRERFAQGQITYKDGATNFYYLYQEEIVKQLNDNNQSFKIDLNTFKKELSSINNWYDLNSKYVLKLTASEFNDLLAVDHLTGHSQFLMQMVGKYPTTRYSIRTKSSYVEELLKYPGYNRVEMQVTMNTAHAINQFEHGTASIDERIHAAKKIQEANGFKLKIILEPMLTYPEHLGEYQQLIRTILKELNPSKIESITLGSLRYNAQLKSMMQLHFPETTLLNDNHKVVPFDKPDTKYRYFPEVRQELYSTLFQEIKKIHDIPIELGSETPALWDALSLDKIAPIITSVYQPSQPLQSINMQNNTEEQNLTQKNDSEQDETLPNANNDVIQSRNILICEKAISLYHEYINSTEFAILDNTLQQMREEVIHDGEVVEEINGWKNVDSHTLKELRSPQFEYQPAKILGLITQVDVAQPLILPPNDNEAIFSFQIQDTNGDSIRTLRIAKSSIKHDIDLLYNNREQCLILGGIVPVRFRTGKSEYRFYPTDIERNVSAYDLVSERPSRQNEESFSVTVGDKVLGIPSDHPSLFISQKTELNEILYHIKSTLVSNLGIQGLEKAIQLDRCIEFMILQAFSQHKDQQFFHKLHSLVIGPPNVGKSYLTAIAKILNPISQEISSNSLKFTSAGLVGTVKPRSNKNISEPGILPQNHQGVVCIQEFHDIRRKKRQEICGLFVRLMEEGQVIDSTSANTIHKSETALHIDMNRYSQINPTVPYNSFSDIDIPMNMLARFDFIMEIPRDSQRQDEITHQMAQEIKRMGPSNNQTTQNKWMTDLQILVAFLRTEYDRVKIPDDVGNYIDQKVSEIISKMRNSNVVSHHVQDFQLRLVRSIFKLVKAIACANASYTARTQYVDYALTFVQPKIQFIASIDTTQTNSVKPTINDKPSRHSLIRQNFSDKDFTIKDILEFLHDQMEGEIDARTVQRDLNELGGKTKNKKKGIWSLS